MYNKPSCQIESKAFLKSIKQVYNFPLETCLTYLSISVLNNINLLQYVTAYVISEKLGKTPKIPKTKSNKRQQPKWKTRIENQIKNMRADLSILTDMAFLM